MSPISIVIPAFNRHERLRRAIESVLSQTGEDFKLVVVDDASDEDLSVLREKVEEMGHSWLRLRENMGPGAARNRGANAVDTEWIAFLDSDDEWMPEKLVRQREWHKANPTFRISQVQEEWMRNGALVSKPEQWRQKGGDLFSVSVERCAIGPSCVMMRRDLWKETGGFDERYRVCEDYELWLRITRAEPVGLVPGPALVRKHGGHVDQLSTSVPALDRFRLVALADLLEKGELTEDQVSLVRNQIGAKARILEAGARKRGAQRRVEFYGRIAGGELTLLSGGPDPLGWGDWAD